MCGAKSSKPARDAVTGCLYGRRAEMSRTKPYKCYGCIHLYARPDAAGGGTYHCALHRIVIGEWGHWAKASDGPKEIDGCWEGRLEDRPNLSKSEE